MRRSTAKSLVALALTGAGSAIVVGFHATDATVAGARSGATSTVAGTATAGASAPTSAGQAGSGATLPVAEATPTATSQSAGAAAYADGTYPGAAVAEPWGTFQVQAVVSGGQLVDVQLVSSPQDRHSKRINGVAVPILTESAIASQSVAVDMVSGATWTSQSYATSLQAALDDARAAVAAG